MNTSIEIATPKTTISENEAALLSFFKALSDATRLRIAGRLAADSCSAAELAAWLGEKPAVVKRHLGRLAAAGLVQGPAAKDQTYRLRLDGVRALAGNLLAHEVTMVPAGAAADDFEHKVLREFLSPDGSIRELPVQEKKLRVVVGYAAQAFEPGQRYAEKEVNTRLKRLHPDTAALRRALVDFGLLKRKTTGQEYWRADGRSGEAIPAA
jgi:DNA-binding transcriptional ArsR family regulator